MSDSFDLRHLRYFVTVAEERHFGRAAQRLFIAQPSLSYTIRQLEDRIGAQLVDRSDRRDLRLTNAGETLLAHAREVLTAVERAVESARATARGDRRQLRVGYNDGEPLARHPGLLGATMRDDGVDVAFRRLVWGTEGDAVRAGEVDVVLAKLPIDDRGLHTEVLGSEPRLACMSADHRLATRRRVDLARLRNVPVVIPTGGNARWVEFWRGMPRPDGHVPPDGPTTFGPEDTFDAVASGVAICFVPASMAPTVAVDRLRFVPVSDLAPVETAVLWSTRRARLPSLEAFVGAARRLVDSIP